MDINEVPNLTQLSLNLLLVAFTLLPYLIQPNTLQTEYEKFIKHNLVKKLFDASYGLDSATAWAEKKDQSITEREVALWGGTEVKEGGV